MPGLPRHGPLRLSAVLEQRMSAGVVPPSKHPAYRGLLGEPRLVVHDPRTIDPGDGYLARREALAPLRATSGKRIAPQRLLAAFGSDELSRLLPIGLEQRGVDAWARGGHFGRVSQWQRRRSSACRPATSSVSRRARRTDRTVRTHVSELMHHWPERASSRPL
jgi:hypothetical protein